MKKAGTSKKQRIYLQVHEFCRVSRVNKGCKDCPLNDLRVCQDLDSISMSRLKEAEKRMLEGGKQ